MNFKSVFWSLIISILTGFISSIGSLINIYWHFISLGIVYFFAIFFFTYNEKNTRIRLIKGFIYISFFIISYIIVVVIIDESERLLISLPQFVVPFISLLVANSLTKQNKIKKIIQGIILFISVILIFGFLIYPNWYNWAVCLRPNKKEKFPIIKLETHDGKIITTESLRGKYLVIEFWSTNCSLCYKKFPQFNELSNYFNNDSNIIFASIHLPSKFDTLHKSKKILDDYDYIFTKYYSYSIEDRQKFGVPYTPLFMIVNKDSQIIYCGNLNTKWYEIVYPTRRLIKKELNK